MCGVWASNPDLMATYTVLFSMWQPISHQKLNQTTHQTTFCKTSFEANFLLFVLILGFHDTNCDRSSQNLDKMLVFEYTSIVLSSSKYSTFNNQVTNIHRLCSLWNTFFYFYLFSAVSSSVFASCLFFGKYSFLNPRGSQYHIISLGE